MSELNEMKISGSGMIPAGEYSKVGISGSGTVTGPVICSGFDVSGSGKAEKEADITVNGNFDMSGSFKSEANLTVSGKAEFSGSAKIAGAVKCDKFEGSGSFSAGSLKVRSGENSGSIKIEGDLEAEYMEFAGSCKIEGLLNAGEAFFTIGRHHDAVKLSQVGCGKLTVELKKGFGLFKHVGAKSYFKADEIEGDEIKLVFATVGAVRGRNIEIGQGCKIDRIEYSGELKMDPKAEVNEIVQAEA